MATASKEESEEDPLPAQVRITRLAGSEWAKMDRRQLNRLPVQKVVTAGFLTASLHQQLLEPSHPPQAARAILLLLRARKRICFLEDGVYRRINVDGWRHDESQVRELGSLRFRSKEAANSIHQLVVSDYNLGPIRRLLEAIFSDQPLDWQYAMEPLGLKGVPIALDRQAVEQRYHSWSTQPKPSRGTREAFYIQMMRAIEDHEDGLLIRCNACATTDSSGGPCRRRFVIPARLLGSEVYRRSTDLLNEARAALQAWMKGSERENPGLLSSEEKQVVLRAGDELQADSDQQLDEFVGPSAGIPGKRPGLSGAAAKIAIAEDNPTPAMTPMSGADQGPQAPKKVNCAEDFSWLKLPNGAHFQFRTPTQRAVFRELLGRWEMAGRSDGAGLTYTALAEAVESGNGSFDPAAYFKGHPAWGTIIWKPTRGQCALYLNEPRTPTPAEARTSNKRKKVKKRRRK